MNNPLKPTGLCRVSLFPSSISLNQIKIKINKIKKKAEAAAWVRQAPDLLSPPNPKYIPIPPFFTSGPHLEADEKKSGQGKELCPWEEQVGEVRRKRSGTLKSGQLLTSQQAAPVATLRGPGPDFPHSAL